MIGRSSMLHLFRTAALAAFCASLSVPAVAQMSASDLVVRLDQLENQVRQLTGQIEQLQYRNQQLEAQVRRLQEDGGARQQAMAPPARSGALPPPPGVPQPPAATGRGDAFDPGRNPEAPGAPRVLGQPGRRADVGGPGDTGYPPRPSGPMPSGNAPPIITDAEEEVGAPGGRQPGAPLDLSTMAGAAARDPTLAPGGSALPPPPPRNPNATGALATLPPTQSPRDEYDLGYGYILRKDYALAEQTLRAFLKKYPNDRLAADAQFWLGESMFQRQNYRDAATAFLDMSKRYESHPKAADALLRLGQSLAALHERELACATLSEVTRKYPRASASVKQATEREQKRAGC
jgi:tol-pal system protein YbgF